jgi:hypothetical protein
MEELIKILNKHSINNEQFKKDLELFIIEQNRKYFLLGSQLKEKWGKEMYPLKEFQKIFATIIL